MSIFDDESLTQGQRLVWFAVQELAIDGVSPDNCTRIADHMGSGRSHVSRALSALDASGWIERKNGVITVNEERPDRASQSRSRDSEARDSQARSSSSSSTPASSSAPPKKVYHSTPLHSSYTPDSTSISEEVVAKIATAPPTETPDGWIGGLPPGHPSLKISLPGDHPARSERHLRYRKAAEWSLELLEEAEDAIESFRLPSSVRKKERRDRLGLLKGWADIFRLLQEQDGVEWSEIKYGIHWLFTQSDWLREGYIASIGSLRRKTRGGDRTKFEAILTQARADSSYDGPDAGGSIGDQHRDESPGERFERKRRAARSAVTAG